MAFSSRGGRRLLLSLGVFLLCVSAVSVRAAPAEEDHADQMDLDKLMSVDDLESHEENDDLNAPEEQEDEYGEGIGAHEWNGKNGHSFETPEEEKMWMEDERVFFNTADKDGDGSLDVGEYKAAMIEDMLRHMEESGKERKLSAEDAEHVEEMGSQFQDEDLNQDGKISFSEWISLAFHEDPQQAGYMNGAREHSEDEIAEQRADAEREFDSFDKDADGKLTQEEVIELVRGETEIGDGEDQVDLEEMAAEVFELMDTDKDAAVTKEEFVIAHIQENDMEPETERVLKHREYDHPPASSGFGWLAKPHPNATNHPATPDGPPLGPPGGEVV